MRTFLLICCFLFTFGGLISQNLNFAEHEAIDKTGGIVTINSKVFYFGSTESNCCGFDIYLRGKDNNGNTLFTTNFGGMEFRQFGKILKTLDNAIFLNYWTVQSCDVGGEIDNIVKLDTNGNILFSAAIQSAVVTGFQNTIVDITQHIDSSFYLVSSNNLYHYSSTGQFISKISTMLTSITSIKALSNGKLFVHGKLNGNNTNVILLPNGSLVKQGPCVNSILKTMEINNYYFSKSLAGVIEKYDTTLTLLDSFDANISPQNYTVNDFTSRHDSIFVVGNYSSGGLLYYTILDTGFTILYQNQSTYKGVIPTGIALTNTNKINVISTCNSNTSKAYTFSGFFQFRTNSGFYAKSDIGVTGFNNVSTWLNLNQSGPITPYLNMDVIIKNFGLDTVRSFYINYYAKYWTCNLLLHKYCQNSIPPGGTLSISTGSFYGQPFYSGTPISSKHLNICVFTSIPNESNDINIDNDSHCDSVLFTVTGIDETLTSEQNIQIFPNPFNESFTIQSEKEMSGYTLYNTLGEKIKEERINVQEFQIHAENLVSGIYFMRIESKNGSLVKKLIKN